MFTNANVLFKAKFRDGVSHVERHVQHSGSSSSVTASTSAHQTAASKGKKVVRANQENEEVNS